MKKAQNDLSPVRMIVLYALCVGVVAALGYALLLLAHLLGFDASKLL